MCLVPTETRLPLFPEPENDETFSEVEFYYTLPLKTEYRAHRKDRALPRNFLRNVKISEFITKPHNTRKHPLCKGSTRDTSLLPSVGFMVTYCLRYSYIFHYHYILYRRKCKVLF